MRVLTVNAGSTSWKVATVEHGQAAVTYDSLDRALADAPPDAVAHRVVHGGPREAPAIVDDHLLRELRALVELAPLHQPPALAAIERVRAHWAGTPQVACFDTAFHATIPEAARTYAIPARHRRDVRAYGFHGLAHASVVRRVRSLAPEVHRVVTAHLGGGQSLCASLDGASVATTMGFTPLDGLVMATRCGALDPGAVLWMARREPGDLGAVLEEQSGLLALGGSADMRVLHDRATAGDGAATLALAVWRHRIVAALGGCVATLGGLDALAFSGGIGEHDARARHAVTDAFAWLGVHTDDSSGAEIGDRELTSQDATVRTFVVSAREDLELARAAEHLVAA